MFERRWIPPADISRAAALLKAGFTARSVMDALAGDDTDLLHQARCNEDPVLHDDRILYFTDHEELRQEHARLAKAYEDDPALSRISWVYGGARIDFHDGVSILFRTMRKEVLDAPEEEAQAGR